MNAAPIQKRKRRFLRIAAAVALGLAILILVAIGAFFEALSVGWFDGVARDAAVKRIADLTGCRVEMGSLHFSELGLRAEVQSFTLHCSEPAGTPPFFHADSIVVALQIDSFWDKKFSLREL